MASIKRRGNSYLVRIRRKGFVKTATFDKKSDAEKWALKMEGNIESGLYVDMGEAQRTTLKDALERYEREVTPKKKGAPQERRRIKMWCKSDLALKTLVNIGGMNLAQWRDDRLADDVSGSTIRNDLHLISNLYKKASKEWGLRGLINPVAQIELPSPNQSRDRRLLCGEEEVLLKNSKDIELNCAIILFIETAMRRSELFSLTLKQIDLIKRVAILSDTKNKKGRRVPLSSRAIETLKLLIKSNKVTKINGRIFYKSKDWVSHAFHDLCDSLKIDGLRIHDLRHEATSRLAESGKFNILELMSITGHSNPKELSRYYHAKTEDLAKRLG